MFVRFECIHVYNTIFRKFEPFVKINYGPDSLIDRVGGDKEWKEWNGNISGFWKWLWRLSRAIGVFSEPEKPAEEKKKVPALFGRKTRDSNKKQCQKDTKRHHKNHKKQTKITHDFSKANQFSLIQLI